MLITRKIGRLFTVLSITVIFFSGCTHLIKYNLDQKIILISKRTLPLNVAVIKFSDVRPEEERNKSSREKKGYTDLGDYTYDKNFKGEVSEAITAMLIEHVRYSRVFSTVERAKLTSIDLSQEELILLQGEGFDAVMTGKIQNFYGYYDRNIDREFLYFIPALAAAIASPYIADPYSLTDALAATLVTVGLGIAGPYFESLHKRDIEWKTSLRLKLVSTSTNHVIWEDTLEVFGKVHKSDPGFRGKQNEKYKIVISSLRDAINKMVKSLTELSF
jgi:hypothetical protein